MTGEDEFRFVTEEAFPIPGRGLVVTGKVEKGSIAVGAEVGFLAADGKWVSALAVAIEISRHLVEEAKVGQQASILLEGVRKGQIPLGTVLQNVPVSPVDISPTPAQPSPPPLPPPVVGAPPAISGGEPIHPSSTSWRTILFIIIGILIILGILYLQGKWDPKKWDLRKRITSIERLNTSFSKYSNQLPAISRCKFSSENFRHLMWR